MSPGQEAVVAVEFSDPLLAPSKRVVHGREHLEDSIAI